MVMNLSDAASAKGLEDEDRDKIEDLVSIWEAKLKRNRIKARYYLGKNKLKDLKIAIPPQLSNVETVVGWPAKAVDSLAARSRFDGFVFNGESGDDMQEILNSNRFRIKYAQLVTSELIHSCAFATITRGGEGEPPVIIGTYSALNAAAVWDERKERIKYGMTVVDVNRDAKTGDTTPIWVNLYTDSNVIEIVRSDTGSWTASYHEHSMGRPLMETFVYRPSLDRPFGKSRITRAVMSITDSAVRAALRTEIAAEFFTTPQRYILGVSEEDLEGESKWDAYMGAITAWSADPSTGQLPHYGQLAQASMQPHVDYMRSLAAQFSGETSIPISDLGIIHDNPSSAEAIYAAKEALVIEAEDLNMSNGEALRELGRMAIAIAKNKKISDLTDDEYSIIPRFSNPARPSIVSQADAVVKEVGAIPWLAESDVTLEELGYTEDQIARLKADKLRAESRARVDALLEVAYGDTAQSGSGSYGEA